MLKPKFAPLYVFLGTKAQYIKMSPVLAQLDRRSIDYILIDSGQHGAFTRSLRRQLSLRGPDVQLGDGADIASIPAAAVWFGSLFIRSIFDRQWLLTDVFRDGAGLCLVHGDTPSTLLATLMARLAGCRVFHVESGLRSFNWLRPFPEEIIRVLTMRLSDTLFAFGPFAAENLARMKLPGQVVGVSQNTGIEALHRALTLTCGLECEPPYAVITAHRTETLLSRDRLGLLVRWVTKIAEQRNVYLILHEPTRRYLQMSGLLSQFRNLSSITIVPLQPYPKFVRRLAQADFVITDGGSIQEECYYLGVPCLLLRSETERTEGLHENVLLGNFDDATLMKFLSSYRAMRRPHHLGSTSPSAKIADVLERHLGAKAGGEQGDVFRRTIRAD